MLMSCALTTIMALSVDDKHVIILLVQNKHNGTKQLLMMLPIKEGPLRVWRNLIC